MRKNHDLAGKEGNQMREILFRAKAVNRTGNERTNYKNGDWVYGWLTKPPNPYCPEKLPANMRETDGVSGIDVDFDTAGQYTGLMDKNGVKIFEGDIVSGIAYSFKRIGVIVWIDSISGFGVRYRKRQDETAWENSSILKCVSKGRCDEFAAEVIGNIYDNPELLEEESE